MDNAIRANNGTSLFLAGREGSAAQVTGDGYTITNIAPLAPANVSATSGGIGAPGSAPFYLSRTTFAILPGYTSGASIAGSMTFSSQSFSSLSLTPGTSVSATITGGGPSDGITVNVVPEPASLMLMVLAGGALITAGSFRRLRSRQTAG